nr:flagellar hook-associated protein FlgK [uncultured Acetatifactor sp.]
MPSQFFGLNIAYTGLLASNASLNTTSNNIANVQTEGYSRQEVTQQAANALRVFQTYGCAGAGVETLAIERIRDEFYDFRYWNNNQKVGEYGQKQYYMKQIEAYFDDNGKNAGFKTVFDQLMITGLQELMKNPNDLNFKQQFVGYAESLTEYFNGLAGNLEKLQKDVNEEIKVTVDDINSIASEIATLNKQINTIEMTGSMKANELRDRRTLLLDRLSEYVDVEVKETAIQDNNNPGRETGGHRFIVKIAGGQVLVDGSDYNGLECVARTKDEKVNQTDIDGLYDVYWVNGSKFNLHNGGMGGSLKGLVDLRDGNNGESFSGTITGTGTTVVDKKNPDGTTTKVTHDTVTVEVGKHYLTDLNKCNLSDSGGVISLGNKEFYYDSWTYNVSLDANGEPVYSYTFTLSDGELNKSGLSSDRIGKTATVGTSISYQGIPYYMAQMNEWVRTFSQKFNDILGSGYSGDIPGIDLFAADIMSQEGQYVFGKGYRYDQFEKQLEEAIEKQFQDDRAQAKQDWLDDPANAGASDEDAEAEMLKQEPALRAAAEAKVKANFSISVEVGKNVEGNENYYLMTAKNFNISSTIEDDPNRLATKKKPGDGVEQNDLIQDLKDMATNKGTLSFRGSSASEFLQCILGDIALNTDRAETFYSSYKDVAYSIDMQRISISGVDEDEEAVNLVRFQNGYNLASKMIQTLTEIYDRLILQTGV